MFFSNIIIYVSKLEVIGNSLVVEQAEFITLFKLRCKVTALVYNKKTLSEIVCLKIVYKVEFVDKDNNVIDTQFIAFGDKVTNYPKLAPIENYEFKIEELWDSQTDESIPCVNPGKLGQTVKMKLPIKCEKDWIIRRKKL